MFCFASAGAIRKPKKPKEKTKNRVSTTTCLYYFVQPNFCKLFSNNNNKTTFPLYHFFFFTKKIFTRTSERQKKKKKEYSRLWFGLQNVLDRLPQKWLKTTYPQKKIQTFCINFLRWLLLLFTMVTTFLLWHDENNLFSNIIHYNFSKQITYPNYSWVDRNFTRSRVHTYSSYEQGKAMTELFYTLYFLNTNAFYTMHDLLLLMVTICYFWLRFATF